MIVLKKLGKAFLELLRCALLECIPAAGVFAALDGKDWRCLLEMARMQRVTAFCYPVIERLPKEVQPPTGMLLQWLADKSRIVYLGEQRAAVGKELLARFEAAGFHPLVMKGWAFAQYYPDPALRMSADLDLYFPERFDKVMTVVGSWGEDLVKGGLHESIDYKGVHVEMHPRLINPASLGRVDEKPVQLDHPSGFSFLSPVDESNAILMVTHMARHMMIGAYGIRHLCDYLLLLHGKGNRLDIDYLRSRLCAMGVGRFSDALQQIGKVYLGIEPLFYCFPPSRKLDKLTHYLMDDVLKTGDDGVFLTTWQLEARKLKSPLKRSLSLFKSYYYCLSRIHTLRPFWPRYADTKTKELILGWFKHRLRR